MDSNSLITKAEEYLKNITREKIDIIRLSDFEYYKNTYNQLNKQLEVLIDYKDSMDTQGYTSPYRSLSKYGINTVSDISAEEASKTYRHNQYFRLKENKNDHDELIDNKLFVFRYINHKILCTYIYKGMIITIDK